MSLPRRRVLLVGWDAADWKVARPLIERGEMPNLAGIVNAGVSGNLATIYPALSPMLWTSIATGKRPAKHGIHGFNEPLPDGSGVRPISSLSRTAKAIWNILNQSGKRSVVTGWWPSHPAEPIHGVMVSDLYNSAGDGPLPMGMPFGTVHPPEWSSRLEDLRLTSMDIPGEILRLFVPDFMSIDQSTDKRLHSLARVIAETMNLHSAATEAIEHSDWDFAGIYYDSIDHFSHGFMKYHPPRLPWVDEDSFRLYQNVISSAYRYHDVMLGRLMQLAGPDTTVIVMSDHGFHSDEHRPGRIPAEAAGPAVEHRHFGIFCMAGPGIRKGAAVYGSGVLDIAPTLLHLYGLPVGEDLDGKVLATAFEEQGAIETVASWETIEGDTGQHPPDTRLDPIASAAAMRQLVELGYIAPPAEDLARRISECLIELKYNLARSHDTSGRPDMSIPIYQEILKEDPLDHRAAEHLFSALLKTGQRTAAGMFLTSVDTRFTLRATEAAVELERRRAERRDEELQDRENPHDHRERHERAKLNEQSTGYALERAMMRLQFAMGARNSQQADASYAALQQLCQEHNVRVPSLILAHWFARSADWERAMFHAGQALEEDPVNWDALALVSRIHFRSKRYQKALVNAAESIALVYDQPQMHYIMGLCFMGLRRYAEAEQPLQIALLQRPGMVRAHDALVRLYADHLGQQNRAALQHLLAVRKRAQFKSCKKSSERNIDAPIQVLPRAEFVRRDNARTGAAHKEIVIVAGLPRSGTSMLMQMLAGGGIDALTDGLRQPDEDNPRGYFEYEPATSLRTDNSWISGARGRAVKLVLTLLPNLPRGETYRILIISRNLTAVLASQQKMLLRTGRAATPLTDSALIREYQQQEHRILKWLIAHPAIAVLPLDYDAVLSNPLAASQAVSEFLDRPFNVDAAARAVEPSLKRQ